MIYRNGYCSKCKDEVRNRTNGWCAKCMGKYLKTYGKERYLERINNHKCTCCGNPNDNIDDKTKCKNCTIKESAAYRKRREVFKLSNMCYKCHKNSPMNDYISMCKQCWFKQMSYASTKSREHSIDIENLFIRQNYKCIYTGEELIPGKNASIDHIIPKSKGGNNDISNLQWVSKKINNAKRDMTHEEFVNFLNLISSEWPKINQKFS